MSAGPAIAARKSAGWSAINTVAAPAARIPRPLPRKARNQTPAMKLKMSAASSAGVGVPAGITVSSFNVVARNGIDG